MNIPLKDYWDLLARHIAPQRGRFILLVGLLLGSIGLRVVNPQIMRSFIDSALAGQAMNILIKDAVIFIGIAIISQVVAVSVTYLGENVAWTATNALRAELAWHALNLDMSFHNDHTPGELIERIDGDVAEMTRFFSQFVITLIGNLLLMIGILAALYREDWRAGLAFTLFAIIACIALYWLRNIAMPHQKARRQAEADLYGFVEEQLAGTEDIRSSGAVDFSLKELFRFQKNIYTHDRRAHFKRFFIEITLGIVVTCGTLLAMVSGYLLFAAGLITIGTVYLFVYYINLLVEPIWAFTHEIESFQTIGACVERLVELRKVQPVVLSGECEPLNGHLPQLAFEGVSFSYNGSDPVLTDLSFQLEPGKVLGLLGRTGSGKTTLARLVFRLYDPRSGYIRLNGMDLRELKMESLRQKVAIVTQDVQLFRASVRDNLTFFDRTIQDEQILSAMHALDLTDWFEGLPQGLDTELSSGNRNLSAGEAQLLAFTRIFLHNPGLVILDEASSRLDPATEQRLERAVDRLLKNRTAIIIAHRLGTVHRADEIMILEGGKVSEVGDRKKLAADQNSQFYHLLQTGLEDVLA